jgi:hypothetical protein
VDETEYMVVGKNGGLVLDNEQMNTQNFRYMGLILLYSSDCWENTSKRINQEKGDKTEINSFI